MNILLSEKYLIKKEVTENLKNRYMDEKKLSAVKYTMDIEIYLEYKHKLTYVRVCFIPCYFSNTPKLSPCSTITS